MAAVINPEGTYQLAEQVSQHDRLCRNHLPVDVPRVDRRGASMDELEIVSFSFPIFIHAGRGFLRFL